MKTLSTAILTLALLQGCGAVQELEKSMTKPTTATSTSTSVASSSNSTTTISGSDAINNISTTTTSSNDTASNVASTTASTATTTSTDGSALTGTWTTECIDGQVYRKVFANETMTMTSYIFKDTACTVKGVVNAQSYAYTIDADKIEITSLPGVSYTFELEGQNTLIIDNDNNFVYTKSAQ